VALLELWPSGWGIRDSDSGNGTIFTTTSSTTISNTKLNISDVAVVLIVVNLGVFVGGGIGERRQAAQQPITTVLSWKTF
jgi:hypothetical protein